MVRPFVGHDLRASKYLPVTDVSLWRCHTRGLRDVATLYVGQYPSTQVFEGKTLTLGGTCSKSGGIVVGDLSALLVERTSFWSGWFRTPRRETALLADFDEKVERICRECASERVTAFAGVPSWNLALLRRMVEYTGRRNLCEVWPHLELFAHGGVGFEPYRAAFRELIPSAGMHYMETYNASEGFFAIADDASRDDMLLMLDYGTYYEFRDGDEVVPLEGVQAGRRYAMLISSCNGLWRYELGDVVEFTGTKHYVSSTAKTASSCKPGKAKVTALAKGKAHPYHLIAVSGGGSTVYGWTDAADIKTSSSSTATSYLVKVTTDVLNIRKGPGTNYGTNGAIRDKGTYTIVAESDGPGASKWGKLKSGAGWISLDYAKKV